MPWLDKVKGVLASWYPGGRGGEAIANILFGKTNPSGRLPITFPASEAQLPNPILPGSLLPRGNDIGNTQPEPFDATYPEGADVGYRWFARTKAVPLFPFGHGLSYTQFTHSGLAFNSARWTATFAVKNTGQREGADVAQLYMTPPGGQSRLVGWARAELPAGESGNYTVTVDPRFAARFDVPTKKWVVEGGRYTVRLASSATDPGQQVNINLPRQTFAVDWKPDGALAVADLAR